MQNVSKLLKQFMKMNSYTTYQLAQLSGVNRTTIQRTLTAGRCPKKEAFEKLSINLNLTDRELEQFKEAYEHAVAGDYIYNRRQYVKRLLEKADTVLPFLSEPLKLEQHVHLDDFPGKKRLIYEVLEIEQLLKVLLNQEVYHQENSEICLLLPPDSQLFSRLLSNIDRQGLTALTLKQLIYLVKNPAVAEADDHYNLRALNSLLPLMMVKSERYHIYYTYSNCVISDEFDKGFPYYILFTDCVLLLSGDLRTAVLETAPEIVNYLRHEFNSATIHCPNFLSSISVEDELQLMLQKYYYASTCYTIEYQPCLLSFVDEEILRGITDSHFPHMEEVIQVFLTFVRRFREFKEIIHIFDERSLEDFIMNGELMMIPREIGRPLIPEERSIILDRLYQCCKEGSQTIRAVNPRILPLSKFFGITVYGSKNIELTLYNKSQNWFHCIMIDENTLYEAFTDFILYAAQSPMVYSQERTLQMIDTYRTRLKDGCCYTIKPNESEVLQ